MSFDVPPGLVELLRPAYSHGVEVTIVDLASRLGLADETPLLVIEKVQEAIEGLALILVPGFDEGELETLRVLRDAAIAFDTSELVRETVASGESQTVEFKASMYCAMKRWAATGELNVFPGGPDEVLKTICAFLNSSGGTLLVGIDDAGDLAGGIELDLQVKGNWTHDKWQLNFWTLIESRFYQGRQVQSYVRAEMVPCGDSNVFLVRVAPRSAPSFVKREGGDYEFFVRSGPRSNTLSMPDFYDYMRVRSGANL